MSLPEPRALQDMIKANPEILRKTVKENPALLDYVFSDAEIRRKYVKVPANIESELKKTSEQLGIAEGVLIGIGIILLLWFLFGRR